MSIRNYLTENLGLAILDKAKDFNVRHYYKLYSDSLNWSRDKVESYQVERLKELLKYAYKNVPFYKKRFDEANFDAEKFSYLDEMKKIPALTRSDIQDNLDELISPEFDLKKCSRGSSSGSTGHPVIYYHDNEAKSANRASVLFFKHLGEYDFGEKWLNIWGNPTAVNVEWKKMSSKFSKLIFNEIRFPAYKLNSKEEFENLLNIFLSEKPKFIYGYTNAIYLFAKYLQNKNIKIDFVRSVFTTAENLHDYQRFTIEKNLGIVYDQYGCSEINGIASQTIYGNNYFVLDPHIFLEFGETVDKEKDIRKLIITDMYNRVMPLIRYENGDLSIPADKNEIQKSKIKYSQFKSIDGRVSDIISLPDGGNLVVPSFFGSRMLKNISGIKQYQIVKNEIDKITINLVTDSSFKVDSKDIITNTLNEYLPKSIKYELIFNGEVIYSQNGKFKLFIDQTKNNSITT